MPILHRIANWLANRVPLGRRGHRDLLETVLRQLPLATYWRLREQGFSPGGIVDIGAHDGDWTRTIKGIFPLAPTLMIEAREEQEPILQRTCAELSKVDHAIALLGSKASKSVQFQISGTGSSIYPERSDAPRVPRSMPMQTLDDIVAKFNRLTPPLFLKLDIQGGELDCLRGGKATLLKSEVIQLEIALLNYNEGAPQAAETIEFMDAEGFSIFDVAGYVRPNGINLVQIDIIFVAKTSKLRPEFFRFNSSQR